MNENKIRELLNGLYDKPLRKGHRRRIVFWFDRDSECLENIESLVPAGVKLHILREDNNFATKKLLEWDDTESSFLIYSPMEKPELDDNWFADTLRYSEEFTPDAVSILANELNVDDIGVKKLLEKYYTFFKSQERTQKVKKMNQDWTWSGETLELAIMAVICKVKSASFEEILRSIFINGLTFEDDFVGSAFLGEMNRFSIEERFWEYARKYYSYHSDKPSLKNLFKSIVLTACREKLKNREDFPAEWKPYLLRKENSCLIFLDHWMKDRSHYETFNDLTAELEEELNVRGKLGNWDNKIENYIENDIFRSYDVWIITNIIEKLSGTSADYDKFRNVIGIRKTKHRYEEFQDIYLALEAAVDYLELSGRYREGFPKTTAYNFFRDYTREYYKIDQAYRKFCTYCDKSEDGVFKLLMMKILNSYSGNYLPRITDDWSDMIEDEMLENWELPQYIQQREFYRRVVEDVTDKDTRRKVFVIISDGLRYEAAEELNRVLNAEKQVKGESALEAMQGSVPSYTRLGMASLLPHEDISIEKTGAVLVDGKGTFDLPHRDIILKDRLAESMAVKYSDLKNMNSEEMRGKIGKSRVVYIYHNTIDTEGDKGETEDKVFEAVERTFEEITDCVRKLVNYVSATTIFITSDHGFLYQKTPLQECDKVSSGKSKTIEEKRRFLLIDDDEIPFIPGTIAIEMKYLLGRKSTMRAIVPRMAHRFKFPGSGIKYVHGGASLQEIVIPLIRFKAAKEYKQKKVDVKLISDRKIHNNKFKVKFLQMEKTSIRMISRRIEVSLWDGEKQISDQKVIIADSTSDNATEREYSLLMTLKSGDYDRNKDYHLRVEDEDGIIDMIPFRIDIAFTNDFGF